MPLILLLSVLLLALPVMTMGVQDEGTASSPPTRASLDVAIEGIERVASSVSNNIYPGQKVQLDVKLVHDDRPTQSLTPITNSNAFTVVLIIDFKDPNPDGKESNVTTMYQQVTSMPLTYTIKDPTGMPNPLKVSFFWNAPKRAPAGLQWTQVSFTVSATITVDDDDKSDNYRTGAALKITEPNFQPRIHEQGEVKPGERGPRHEARLGQPVFFDFELWNEGPAVDIIGIDFLSVPEGWRVDNFAPQEVFPNNFVPLPFAVLVPSDPTLAISLGNQGEKKVYEVIARPYSTFFPEGPYDIEPIYTFQFEVVFEPGCRMWPLQQSVFLVPGVKTPVNFNLENTGNGFDSFTVTFSLDERASKEWKLSGGGLFNVGPGEITQVTVNVIVPPNTAKNQNVNLMLTAESSTRPGLKFYSELCTIWAAERYAAKIEDITDAFLVEPGKENRIEFMFWNMGNDNDPNQELRVTNAPRGWRVFIDQSPLRSGYGLGPMTPAKLSMTLFVPETSLTSTKVQKLPFVQLSAYGGPNLILLDQSEFLFDVPLKTKVALSTETPTKTGFVGGNTEFIINVQNRGNYDDSVNISTDFDWADLEYDIVQQIAPNDTIPVRMIVRIPNDASADTNPDTPRTYDGYKIMVKAYSQNETRKGSTLVSLELTLRISPFFSFEMELAPNEPPIRFSTDHDQTRAVKVRIKNTGNVADLVKLEFKDNPYSSWVRLQNVYIDIPYKSYFDAIITFNPRAYTITEPQQIDLVLMGTSTYDPDQKSPFETEVTLNITFFQLVFDIASVRMNNETVNPQGMNAELDTEYSFQVVIDNKGTEDLHPKYMGTLNIVLYDADFEVDRANITFLETEDTKTVFFKWYAPSPGPHDLTFALEENDDLLISDQSIVEEQIKVIVRYPEYIGDGDENEDQLELIDLMPQIILMIIFGLGIFVFLYMFNQIFISAIDTGYDEDGTYRPWAVREKLRESEKLESAPERPGLPAPTASPERQLPPAPAMRPAAPVPTATAVQPTPAQATPAQSMRPPMPGQMPMARPQMPSQGPTPVAMPQPVPAPGQMPVARPMPATPVQPTPVRPPQPPQ